ncbi:MAG: hypothetical protein O3B47_01760 [bacterium]|nr:hypothetical protein [bacterium]
MKKLLLILTVLIVSSPLTSAASFETAENFVLTEQSNDDKYILTGNGNIEADVLGDLYIGGGSIVVNGNVLEDLVIVGGKVTVAGDVAGDLRILGGQVQVSGNVGDDVIVAGGQIDLGKDSRVGGSFQSASGIVTIDGVVKEDVRGVFGMLFLNGEVTRDVIVTVEDSLIISKLARIGGDLKYSALLEASIPENVVAGDIAFNKFEREGVVENLTFLSFIQKFLSFVSALLLMVIIVMFSPKPLVRSAELTRENVLRSFGIGLLTVIGGVIGPILLMVTVVGIPIALIVFVMILVAFYFVKIFVAAWLASYFFDYKRKKIWIKPRYFLALTIALLAYYLIGIIPYIGWFINIILFLIGLGSLMLVKIELFKSLRAKKML